MRTQDHSQRPHRPQGDILTEGAQVEIGGDERYVAVCRKCWRNKRIAQAERLSLPFFESLFTASDTE